jgi:hypothetical protein
MGGGTEQKTRLRIQATSTIESDGLRSGRNRRMATIRDRLGHMTATQRLGSIKDLLMRANLRPVCWLWVNRSSTASQRGASAARVSIELTHNPFKRMFRARRSPASSNVLFPGRQGSTSTSSY